VRQVLPTSFEWVAAGATTLLLILSFPNFEFFVLAWIALVPLLVVVGRRPDPLRALILGWATGAVFFYTTCYWLTYSMIHYGGIPTLFAYLLLVPGALILGLFPATFAWISNRTIRSRGEQAVFLTPFVWTSLEWTRLEITGQLWNAIGYSQAFTPQLIQAARWGGIYAVGFLIMAVNAALTFAVLKRTVSALAVSAGVLLCVAAVILLSYVNASHSARENGPNTLHVVALQPDVPMDLYKSSELMGELTRRHIEMSETALSHLPNDGLPRLVIWPESPMSFAYGTDATLRQLISRFTQKHNSLLLLNSQEQAPNSGQYNSALLINEEGTLVGQYDKIRLLPFGEYVPLPRWLPGANLITAIVGDFTPGTNYAVFPIGVERAGVFICIEAAYPEIARRFTNEGANLLINISNDGYLGRTAVMRQHLSNAVLRAVENGTPILRVTNTGITAYISETGKVSDVTAPFEAPVRSWTIRNRSDSSNSFYTAHGDLFVGMTFLIAVIGLVASSFKTIQPTRN